MPSVFHWSLSQFQVLLLILMRVSPILFMMPVLSAQNLPNLLRVGLTLSVGFVLWTVVRIDDAYFPSEPFGFAFFLLSEFMIGFILGLSIRLVFAGVQLAGEFAALQMGLSMANIVDPQSGFDTTLIAQFYYLSGLLLFLSIDGHHWFFRALAQSFQLLPPGTWTLREGLYQHLLDLSGKMFLIAIKMVAPIMVTLILVQIALGLVARMVPQVNILMSSFPLTIGLGLVFLVLSLDLVSPHLKTLFEETGKGMVVTLLPLMKP